MKRLLCGLVFALVWLVGSVSAEPANPKILMFVAYDQVWWGEYKVLYEGLRAAGYDVDVVSSGTGVAHSYGNNVAIDANAISSYAAFTDNFSRNFGTPWLEAWNTPQDIPLDGRIQDVSDLSQYVALVAPGGTGMANYLYDGVYSAFDRATENEVRDSAEKLNQLTNEALQAGKPIAAACHAGNFPVFVRVPGTMGQGADGLGRSVLEGHTGTALTDEGFATHGVSYRGSEKVIVDGPDATAYPTDARDLIAMSADWYPQTTSYLARTLLNMLESYPSPLERAATVNVLIFGGGEPNHYSDPGPAYYSDLAPLLNDNTDEFNYVANATNQTNDLTLANLNNYDVLLYFRHTDIPTAAEDAIATFVDNGGGLVGIHHAIWNPGSSNPTIIDLFGGELPQGIGLNDEHGLQYYGEENRLINVNYGEFVSTFGVNWEDDATDSLDYTSPLGIPSLNDDNDGARGYFHFTIPANDELYLGARFNAGVTFGRAVNEINRIFSNDRTSAGSPNPNDGHYDTAGWTRVYDGNGDDVIGRIVYLQPGETMVRTFAHPSYVQVVKNSVLWASLAPENTPTAVTLQQLHALPASQSLTILLICVTIFASLWGRAMAKTS